MDIPLRLNFWLITANILGVRKFMIFTVGAECPLYSLIKTIVFTLRHFGHYALTLKVPNTTIADFSNTVDPDDMAHDEPPHLQ